MFLISAIDLGAVGLNKAVALQLDAKRELKEENSLRRIQAINNTKIKYLSVADSKIYKVKEIDFRNLTIEATETDLSIADVPGNEVFPIEELGEFRVRLCNGDER